MGKGGLAMNKPAFPWVPASKRTLPGRVGAPQIPGALYRLKMEF